MKQKRSKKLVHLGVRVTQILRWQIQEEAEIEGRTDSEWVRRILNEICRELRHKRLQQQTKDT
jgi:hypothetical protein